MSPAAKAVNALRDAADALDALPVVFRQIDRLGGGYVLSPARMRNEADYIERVAAAVSEVKAS